MIIILSIFLIFAYCLLGTAAVLIWTMQKRIESLTEKLSALALKVKEGEHVIIENFEIVEKRFTKLEHEIKDSKRSESGQRRQEILKVTKAIQRANSNE